ncbi:MAG: AraC family transcriptional regulator [Syntrophomonadaceae bacterium]|nr:AraC family transcriptional regulator [Syntrophomonadaceae bacterium]
MTNISVISKQKIINESDMETKHDNERGLLSGNQSICNAYSRMSQISPQRYEFLIPEEIGRGYFRQISTHQGIIVSEFRMCYKRDTDVIGKTDASNIDICFCLKEGIEWEWEWQNACKQLQINKGESFISNSRNGIERSCYPSDREFEFIRIRIPIYRFYEMVWEYGKEVNCSVIGSCCDCFKKYSITPSVQVILQQMLSCPYKDALLNMYTEGKLLELLAVYLSEALLQTGIIKDAGIKLSRTDKDCIFRAREILDQNMTNPPSCVDLSRMVYLSESKLTKGFKALFGMPVHAYIIDKRLETTLLLLEKGESSVSKVAGMVGYGNISHFAAAFKKKYGMNPGELVKRKSFSNQ